MGGEGNRELVELSPKGEFGARVGRDRGIPQGEAAPEMDEEERKGQELWRLWTEGAKS